LIHLFNTINEERQNWFCWLPVIFGMGILFHHSLSFEPDFFALSVFCFCLLISLILFLIWLFKKDTYYATPVGLVVWGPIIFLLGLWASAYEINKTLTKFLEWPIKEQTLRGTIKAIEMGKGEKGKNRVILDISKEDPKNELGVFPRVGLKVPEKMNLPFNPGDQLEVVANLMPISPPSSPFAYNYRKDCFFKGIGAFGSIKKIMIHEPKEDWGLDKIRFALSQRLRKKIKGQEGEIAAALITGDRSGITLETRESFSRSGLSHILAISGLHVSLVAGIMFLLFRIILGFSYRFCLFHNLRKWSATLVIPATFFYVALSNFGFPGLRAFTMTSLVMLALLFERQPLSLRSVALAALIILAIYPSALFSLSFQLSFAAVVALISFYEDVWSKFSESFYAQKWWKKVAIYFLATTLTTLVATLATTPFIINSFHTFTLQGVLGNILAIPLTGFLIMPLGVFSVFSVPLGGWDWIFSLWRESIALLVSIADNISGLPGSSFIVPKPGQGYLTWFIFGGLWFLLWKRKWCYWGIIPLLGSHCFLFIDQLPQVYVNADGNLAGFRSGEDFYISHPYRNRFIAEQWMAEVGAIVLKNFESPVARLGSIIINARQYKPLRGDEKEMCENAQWEIQLIDGATVLCPEAKVYSQKEIRKKGGLAFWVSEKETSKKEIKTQDRPWS
jgi:competence protein ComEC